MVKRHCLSKIKNKHGHRHTHFDKHCSANYVEKVLSKQLLLTVSLSFLKDQGFFFMLLGMSQIELLDSDLQGIFQRYDRDRSGKIDLFELRDALYGTGYAIPASVLQLLVSKYDDGSGRRVELNFDSFVE